ncbi:YybS family protein [Alkalithermobacter paradoxus]|uniref:DUF2232 domain-containing protein n=1 Tax=Alkalithermobacter paradoxus TaxID=29349 RepID=A0A1V4I655_9FIRM|nr:hypothetical protein CLOTH_14960 [[Clostridium] thermoalcaliphilum]
MTDKTNRQRLTESAIVSVIGIVFALMCTYLPVLNLLTSLTGLVYVVITFRNGVKYGILSVVISSFIISLIVDPIYSLTLGLIFFLPGVAIGYGLYKSEKPFYAISLGFIVSIVVTIIYTRAASVLFGVDLIESTIEMIKEASEIQNKMLEDLNLENQISNIDIVEFISTVIPSMIAISSIIMSFINYYLSIFVLKKIKSFNRELPTLKEFTLPGNVSLGISIIFLLTIISRNLKWIYYQTLVTNITIIFFFLFLLQGIAVFSYFIDKVKTKRAFKNLLIILGILIGPMILNMISLIGLLDSILNFRKIRR